MRVSGKRSLPDMGKRSNQDTCKVSFVLNPEGCVNRVAAHACCISNEKQV